MSLFCFKKHEAFSEWYNAIIKQTELCDLRYNIKGFVVILPWAMKSIDKIYELYEKELEQTKHSPVFFPSLISEKALKTESTHVAGFIPEVLWVTEAGDKKLEEKYALRPTGETAIYPMYALWINGIKDLPLKLYQRGWVWRHETKATKPFIRGREFLWIETHDVFATPGETEKQIIEDVEMAKKVIWEELCVPFIFFKRPQWDKFPGADDTFAGDVLMPDGRLLQVISTHLLGQRFSKAFNIKYMNEKNEEVYAWQTTCGPGISRIYAAMFAVNGDDKGLVLPFRLAPIQVVIVPIMKKGEEKRIVQKAQEIVKKISKIAKVEIDLREHTPGFKFNYWEQKGVPLRIEIGMHEIENNDVVIVRRYDGKKKTIKIEEIEDSIREGEKELKEYLKKQNQDFLDKNLDCAETIEELAEKISKNKVVKTAFCTDKMNGKKCAEEIKEKYACDVRGTVFSFYNSEKYEFKSSDKPHNKNCINCGKPAQINVYIAKQY